MSNLVDPADIERIVGVWRDPTRHLARAVSATETIYILHSALCFASGLDLRTCSYSRALDVGINRAAWEGMEDVPVILGLDRRGLVPLRKVYDAIADGLDDGPAKP